MIDHTSLCVHELTYMEKDILARMREKGLKISQKRIWIVEAVCDAKCIRDVGAFWMHLRSVKPVSWATTYSTLRVLSEYGIIEKTNLDGKSIVYRVLE